MTLVSSIFDASIWIFLTAIFGFFAVVVPLFTWWRARTRKSLSYRLTVSPIASVASSAASDIAMTYQGHTVTNVHLVAVTFENDGNVPIVASDFEDDLEIKLGTTSRALKIEVQDRSPADLDPHGAAVDSAVRVQALLLNPGDSFTVSIVVRDYDGPVAVHARIAGVSRVGAANHERGSMWSFALEVTPAGTILNATPVALGTALAVVAGIAVPLALLRHKPTYHFMRIGSTTVCARVVEHHGHETVIELKQAQERRLVRSPTTLPLRC